MMCAHDNSKLTCHHLSDDAVALPALDPMAPCHMFFLKYKGE